MKVVVDVKFKSDGRAYYFDPGDTQYNPKDKVIVETSQGIECGEVSLGNHSVEEEKIVSPLKKVIRAADSKDFKKIEDNKAKAQVAFDFCEKKIIERSLDMKLVDVEYSFDATKIVFYFTSDGRVDFRELVKDLAQNFHTRIELRQIGVRDEAKMLGGLGICGRPFCCAKFLDDFQPVSIKMAKSQGLSLNPSKISGTCGRLMCCLKYEQDAYDYLIKLTPQVGSLVKVGSSTGSVVSVNVITGALFVKLDDSEAPPIKVHRDEVKVLSNKKGKKPQPTDQDIPDEI